MHEAISLTVDGGVESASFIAQRQQNRCFSKMKYVKSQQFRALQLLSLHYTETETKLQA